MGKEISTGKCRKRENSAIQPRIRRGAEYNQEKKKAKKPSEKGKGSGRKDVKKEKK